jgi:hypothetical protein
MAEHVIGNPVELGVEVPGSATSTAVASDDAGASSGEVLVLDAIMSEQPALGQGRDVGSPVPSAMPKEVDGQSRDLLRWQTCCRFSPPPLPRRRFSRQASP